MITMVLLTVSSLVGALAYAALAQQLGGRVRGERKARVEASTNYLDGAFRNPVETSVSSEGSSSWRTGLEWFTSKAERVPASPIPVDRIDPAQLGTAGDEVLRAWWLGHSSVLLEVDGALVLTDPVFARRASPLPGMGPRRFSDELPITAEELPPLDVVLISHDHYDHLDLEAIRALKDKVGAFHVPLGVGAHLERWGVPAEQIVELDWWEDTTVGGLTLTLTPSRHFSGRRGIDGMQTLWGGWVVQGPHHRVYFSGDSGYWDGFADIGRRLGPFDLTLMECGAYNDGWASIHMTPEQTAQAHQDLGGGVLLPIHWGRFNLSLHAWNEPIQRLESAASAGDIRLATPRIGQGFDVDGAIPQSRWWLGDEALAQSDTIRHDSPPCPAPAPSASRSSSSPPS
jgi:L-ascorbate metabolism protein UlaG (beta-lactamase superfamily)